MPITGPSLFLASSALTAERDRADNASTIELNKRIALPKDFEKKVKRKA
jgi:hypothetical protein